MNQQEKLSVIVLAAGKGTRMKSPLPKVLHPVAGRPMLESVVNAAKGAGATEIRVVVGHGSQLVKAVVENWGVICKEQKDQLGTADAVKSAGLSDLEGEVIIMNGDHPLIEASDLKNIVQEFRDKKADLAVVTSILKAPGSFGRVIRHQGEMVAIVEAKDASSDTLKIKEVNTGIYVVRGSVLRNDIGRIQNKNSKKEFYLTDIIAISLANQREVIAIQASPKVAVGVNTQLELAKATKKIYARKIKQLMESGVMVLDPKTTYVEEAVTVGQGSVLYPGSFLRGKTRVGAFSVVEPNAFISDSDIGDSVQIRAGSYLERAVVHSKCIVGPYARLRPGTVMMDESQVGNFVELKKVTFGKKSKAAHLTYLGDADIGEGVNVGCGTITCNYAADKNKYKTKIGNNVFVGSDSQFVAPVTIGDNAVIGSGSTITKDVPANALAVARAKQFVKENYSPKGSGNAEVSKSSIPESSTQEDLKKEEQ